MRVRARVHQRALQIRRVEGLLEQLGIEHAEKVENHRELPVSAERGDLGGRDLGSASRRSRSGSSLAARASRRAAIFTRGMSSSSSSLSKSSEGSLSASSFLASSFLASSFLASSFLASSFLASSFLASSPSSSFFEEPPSFFEGASGPSPFPRRRRRRLRHLGPSPRGRRAGRVPRGSRRRRRHRSPGRPLRRRRYPRLSSPSFSVSRPGYTRLRRRHARIFLSCFEQSGMSACLPVWLTTRCAQRENSAAASGHATLPCGIAWGKRREFRRWRCRDEIAQLKIARGVFENVGVPTIGTPAGATRRRRRDARVGRARARARVRHRHRT